MPSRRRRSSAGTWVPGHGLEARAVAECIIECTEGDGDPEDVIEDIQSVLDEETTELSLGGLMKVPEVSALLPPLEMLCLYENQHSRSCRLQAEI